MADDSVIRDLLKPGERPTLKTIARITGLAVATVSRALNDAPDIGQNTKRRVHECATQIGYRPNRAGVRLRTGKTNVISLVLSTEHDLMNHTARLLNSVAGGLRGTPFHLIVTPFFPDQDPMAPVRYIVETNSADGIIINQIEPDDPRVNYLREHGFPFATHGRTDKADEHAYFDFDNAAYTRVAVEELHKRGRRNVLLIAPPLTQSYAQHMVNGLHQGAAATGVKVHVLVGVTSDSPAAKIRAAIADHLNAHPETDAIITGSANSAMATVAALEGIGRELGGDIDVFAKEAIPFLHVFRPKLLVMSEDVWRAGKFLSEAVVRQIDTPDAPPMQGLEIPTFTPQG